MGTERETLPVTIPSDVASPACTIIVIALHGGTTLDACLNALAAQRARCVVMLGPAMNATTELQSRHPDVRFVAGPPFPVPARRARGVALADSEWVGLIEDSSTPGSHWLEALSTAATDAAAGAVGGPVTISPEASTRQQALGCSEFGRFHPAFLHELTESSAKAADGAFEVRTLAGNNVAYRRSALTAIGMDSGDLIETDINAALRATGRRLLLHPGMLVRYQPGDDHGTRGIDRFRHGRLYGGRRVVAFTPLARLVECMKAPLLPLLLSARSLRRMVGVVPVRAWAHVAPRLCGMEIAWALGEAVGYVAGPGRSAEQWL